MITHIIPALANAKAGILKVQSQPGLYCKLNAIPGYTTRLLSQKKVNVK